ncbi:MAG TPA: glycosyltransferase [Actinomycetota bacterium]|nr:glycosyltransferase [Actinomycetota bacterium]
MASVKKLWDNVRNTDLAKHGVVLFVALTIAGISNLLFHFAIGRLLGPGDYGAFGALLSAFNFVAVVASAVQAVVAKRTSVLRASGSDEATRATLKACLRGGGIVAAVVGAGCLAAAPVLKTFFKLDSLAPALMLAAYVVVAIMAPVVRGALQGRLLFIPLAAIAVGTTLLRLASGVLLVKLGFGVTGAVAASVIGDLAGLFFGLLPLRGFLTRSRQKVALKGLFREGFTAMVAFGGFFAVWNFDTPLVRHYSAPETSGFYTAGAVVAHIVFFLPGAIAMVAFPRFAESGGRSVEARRTLFHSIVAVSVMGFGSAAVLSLFSPLWIRLLYGAPFISGAQVVPTLSLAMALLGIVNLLVYFHMASNSKALYSLIPAVVLEAVGIALFHESLVAVAAVVLVVSAILLAFNLIAAYAHPGDPSVQPVLSGELWQEGSVQLDLSVVTPAFNPGSEFKANLDALLQSLEEAGLSYEVIAVSDGSTDGSHLQAEEIEGPIRLVHYDTNRGKGYALRTGLAMAKGSYVAFIDSDGDLDPSSLASFIGLMQAHDVDLVVGSKRHPDSKVSYPPLRRVMSWTYHKLVRVMFGVKLRDTQTGLKLARRELLAGALPRMLEKRFAFDLELLVVSRLLGFTKVMEAPVKLNYQFTSTVSWRTTVAIIIDTLAIFYRRYILRYYDHFPGEPEVREETPDLPVEVGEVH